MVNGNIIHNDHFAFVSSNYVYGVLETSVFIGKCCCLGSTPKEWLKPLIPPLVLLRSPSSSETIITFTFIHLPQRHVNSSQISFTPIHNV